ncbi:MAG: hypothetical protein ACFB0Z_11995 [Candidatus Phaeomarinobacter sp.]
MTRHLKNAIAEWDGKAVDAITRIHEAHKDAPDFSSTLIACLSDPACERGVTWLIKHHLEEGWSEESSAPTPKEVMAILKALPDLAHWEAQLHVLQCLDRVQIPKPAAAALAAFLETAIASDTKFVRAWAYHGWYLLADQHRSYRPQTMALLEAAHDIESAPSAKVKIRNALERLAQQ